MKQLTKRENQIMTILWNNDHAMSASDIKLSADDLSIYTVQQVLQKLTSMNYIRVSGIGHNKKAITRLYEPAIAQEEYILSFLKDSSALNLATYFIESNNDLEIIKELESLIQKKKKELEEK